MYVCYICILDQSTVEELLETILRNIGANAYSMHGYMIAGEEISAQVRRAAQAIRSRSALLRWGIELVPHQVVH